MAEIKTISHKGKDVYPRTVGDAVSIGNKTLTAVLKDKVDAELGKGLYPKEDKEFVSDLRYGTHPFSEQNKLVSEEIMNNAIQTETAVYRGSFDDWKSVPDDHTKYDGYEQFGAPNNNDYLVVREAKDYAPLWRSGQKYEVGDCAYDNTPDGLALYQVISNPNPTVNPYDSNAWQEVSENPNYKGTWRFKFVGIWFDNEWYAKFNWKPEYLINKFPLTDDQVNAVNSGITEADVTRLRGLDEVFYAEYGVATFDEVKSAFENNKLVWTKYGNAVYILSYFSSSERVVFARVGDSNSSSATVLDKNEGWQGLAYFYAADYTIKSRVEKLETLIYAAL
jgi:hypothetical protein